MLLSFWARRKYAHLRCLMRGYAWCKRHSGFAAIRRLKNELIDVHVGAFVSGAEWFFGASAPRAELVVRQFVYDRYGGGKLNHILFGCIGCRKPIAAGMPVPWRTCLKNAGWPVSYLASSFAWQAITVLRLLRGVLRLISLCAKLAMSKQANTASAPYVYFEGLTRANLPVQSGDEGSYDICTFYAQWQRRSPQVQIICHDVADEAERKVFGLRVRHFPPAYELARGANAALKLAWWGARASVLAVLQMLRGRWQWALMLEEATKAKAIQLAPQEGFATEYWFHASRTIYRPMWTYEVEQKGSKVVLYFYSTTVQPKLKTGYESQRFEWGPNTWPCMIVWDNYQEERIRKDLGDEVEILQAGPIPFSDSSIEISPLPPNSIAVFDLQPYRPSMHLGISTLTDCMADNSDYFHRFLSDVAEVLDECGVLAVLKTKREIGARGDRRYEQILKRLQSSRSVCMIDPAVSAIRVAARCCAGISAPFTSAALYVRALGRPSIYYDPYGWIQRDDRGAHGIPVLCGKDALRTWVVQTLSAEVANR